MSLRKRFFLALPLFFILSTSLQAQQKLKNFYGTPQRLALVSLVAEFMDVPVEEKLTKQLRASINRYSKTFTETAISGFTLGQNPGEQFFKTSPDAMPPAQKKFLQALGKDNSVDIIVLGTMRETSDEIEIEMQLFDIRIDVLSAIEKTKFAAGGAKAAVDRLIYKLMNYLDRDGYVHNSSQDFLEEPDSLKGDNLRVDLEKNAGADSFSMNPNELGQGALAGGNSIGGDRTPFWETWWFWTLLVGGAATAGGLTYYFAVVDQAPSRVNVGFRTAP